MDKKAKVINILDSGLNYKGLIDDYTSFLFTRRFHSFGEFVIQTNLNKNNVEFMKKGHFVFMGTDKHKCGIIMSVEKVKDNTGALGEQIVAKGLEVQSLFARRIIIPNTGQSHVSFNNQSAETIFKNLVSSQTINSENADRVISLLQNAEDIQRGPLLSKSYRFKKLSDEFEKLSKESKLGIKMTVDTSSKKIIFDVYEGVDRRAGNGVNPHAIFSSDYDNLESQRYIESDYNKATFALAAGQGEGIDRELYEKTLGETGLERFEEFVDARDAETTQVLASRADQKLIEMQGELSFEGMIMTSSNLIYELDYDLGDQVTVIDKKWGMRLDTRLTEITEIYEREKGFRVEPVFGETMPSLVEVIKKSYNHLLYQE